MTKDREQKILERITDLERRVKELEAQPREYHYHYHPPVFQQPSPATIPGQIYIGDPPYNPSGTTWVWRDANGAISHNRPATLLNAAGGN